MACVLENLVLSKLTSHDIRSVKRDGMGGKGRRRNNQHGECEAEDDLEPIGAVHASSDTGYRFVYLDNAERASRKETFLWKPLD